MATQKATKKRATKKASSKTAPVETVDEDLTDAEAEKVELKAELVTLVDAIGEDRDAIELLEVRYPQFARLASNEKRLKALIEAQMGTASKTGKVTGNSYILSIGLPGTTRQLAGNDQLYKFLGKAKFLELAKIGIGDISKQYTDDQLIKEGLLTVGTSKTRSRTYVLRGKVSAGIQRLKRALGIDADTDD